MSQKVEKGSDLEQRIEAFFKLHGYGTQRNVIREGRSGAPHEIDVLATRSDGVTELTIAVECKAWELPIEKDVVSKLSMELADLGINKGIVVSLRGWTSGAELTAKQLGIELWGTEEIQNRLGQVAVAEISTAKTTRVGRGFPLAIGEPELSPRLIATARGFLGFGRENLVWIKLLWVPFALVELDHASSRSTFLKGTVTETTKRWNLYEGLTGGFLITFENAPEITDVATGHALPMRFQTRKLERDINDTIKRAQSVVRQTTQARYASRLTELGIPSGTESTSVIHTEVVHLPFFAALLGSGDRHRVVAVDAVWGTRWRAIDETLSQNVSFITESFGAEAGPEAAQALSARRSSRPGLIQLAALALLGVAEYFAFGSSWVVAYTLSLALIGFIAFKRWQREQGY